MRTAGRVVNALDQNQGIANASVAGELLTATTANSLGEFTLATTAPTGFPALVRIFDPAIVERQVYVKVPGDPVVVTAMPASMNLTYFNEMCRSFGGIARWMSAPALVVERAALEYGSRMATAEVVPDDSIATTVAELRQLIPVLSAGRYPDFASIEYRTTPAGVRSLVPEGAIGLTWQTRLLDTFGHVAYGAREVAGGMPGLLRGEVAFDRDWHLFGLPVGSRRDHFNVLQHELGHAMGFSHTKTSPSFMYEVFLMTISPLDRQAFEIYMQRPSGNRTPDADPSGTSANLGISAPRGMIVERCEFLRR
jgi:hypothetical protein